MKKLVSIVSLAALIIGFSAFTAAQVEAQIVSSTNTTVHAFADLSAIDGGYANLVRTENGVTAELHTYDLNAGAPYTVWWVVFNTPEGCSDACGEDDIVAEDGTTDFNPDANISILFADGGIAADDGSITFSSYLPEGRTLGQVLAGEGLWDAQVAEVHLVVRDHGPLDPDRLYEQLSTFEPGPLTGGSCEICFDVQFSVFLPPGITAGN